MRFIMLMIPKGYEQARPGTMPDSNSVAAMMKYNESLQKAGVKSKQEAIEWASRCPASDNEVIEVRQVQEFTDFPADVQEAAAGFSGMPAPAERPRGRKTASQG